MAMVTQENSPGRRIKLLGTIQEHQAQMQNWNRAKGQAFIMAKMKPVLTFQVEELIQSPQRTLGFRTSKISQWVREPATKTKD